MLPPQGAGLYEKVTESIGTFEEQLPSRTKYWSHGVSSSRVHTTSISVVQGGADVGLRVGGCVGSGVGGCVGGSVGTGVGGSVGTGVGGSVGDGVGGSVNSSIGKNSVTFAKQGVGLG